MNSTGPIGVFDSGVGGLTVAAAIRALLPAESIIYLADSANFPYGPKPAEQVRRLSRDATRLLLAHGAKLIVVACNTASSAALASLRADFPDVPFVGMVPAVKPASAATRTQRVGVLATKGTVQGQVLGDLIAQFADGVEVHQVAAAPLAELVEFGRPDTAEGEQLVRRFVEPLLARDVDVLVLGCSHFTFLRPLVQRIAGEAVLVFDTTEAVAQQVARVVAGNGSATTEPGPSFRLLTTGRAERLRQTLVHLEAAAPGLLPTIDAVESVDTSVGAELP